MHYKCEVVIPPTLDVEDSVEQIMRPFGENLDEDDPIASGRPFFDFWVLGGRFAGAKLEASLEPQAIDAFNKELAARKVTVSGFTAGKQELSPASQIPMVDKLWGEFFPQFAGQPCPMFKHSNDQYDNDSRLPSDICPLGDVPPSYKCARVIFAGPAWDQATQSHHWGAGVTAEFMVQKKFWNGVNHQETAWGGKLVAARRMYEAKANDKERLPTDDWLSVTVDYHS